MPLVDFHLKIYCGALKGLLEKNNATGGNSQVEASTWFHET
jgi:hypothetical protein